MAAVVVLAVGLVLGGVAVAAPATPPPDEQAPPDAAAPVAIMAAPRSPNSPLPPKAMEAGPEHKMLAGFVGHWKTSLKVEPTVPPTPAKNNEGTADGKLVMGGRFAQVTQVGMLDGKPFEGMFLCGFDKAVSKFTAAWIDNQGTAIIHYVGTYDESKKQLTMSSHYSDQWMRKLTIARIVVTFVDANTMTYDEYIAHAVGEQEAHTVSMTYKKG
jgi:hypothetical protein